MKKLYCPVRRLENPSVNFKITRGKDDLVNIDANIKIKDPVSYIIDIFNKKYKKRCK